MSRSQSTAVIFGVLSVSITAAVAQLAAPAGYDLSWNTVDGGGGSSTGGAFSISGTVGQPDAGVVLAGGAFEVIGGFWAGGSQPVETCPADIAPPGPPMGDGLVNVTDLLAVIAAWGQTGDPPADINGDHIVNVVDLLAVIGAWGTCPP